MACVIFGEVLLSGRVAYGEHHDYTLFWSQTEARATDGALLFADTLKFIPQSASPEPIWTTRAVRCAGAALRDEPPRSSRILVRPTAHPSDRTTLPNRRRERTAEQLRCLGAYSAENSSVLRRRATRRGTSASRVDRRSRVSPPQDVSFRMS